MSPLPGCDTAPLADFLAWARAFLGQALMLPEQASSIAGRIDDLQFVQITFFSGIGACVMAATFWFSLRYRELRDDVVLPTARVQAPAWLELGLSAVLLATFVSFWVVGFKQFVDAAIPPADAMDVYVEAKQWMWKFSYADGRRSAGVLYVPLGRPVRLVLTSRDVIHSFFVPAFRVKQDVIPGRYTSLWFEAEKRGRFQVLCAELCGAGHSRMWAEVVVLDGRDFAAWMGESIVPAARGPVGEATVSEPQPRAARARDGLIERGMQVAADKGCMRCHTTDGTAHVGPSWRGLWGSTVTLQDGAAVTADAAYLTKSMMDPMEQLVAGFAAVMPTYQGRLSPDETAALLELIRSLRERGLGSAPPGAGVTVAPAAAAEQAER